MAKTEYTLADVMLTLAAIAYRGWELVLPAPLKQAPLYRAMTECLHTLGPVKDQWDIVWGPASFSPGIVGFGDVTMYAARNIQQPSRFAVAVRGTNPISLSDWIFGDLLVNQQAPWAYGDTTATPNAKISFSTALGVRIVQHLRSNPPAQRTATGISGIVGTVDHTIRDAVGAVVERVEAAVSGPLGRPRTQLVDALRSLRGLFPQQNPDSMEEWIAMLRQQRSSLSAQRVLQVLDESLQHLEGTRLDPLQLIVDATKLEQELAAGVTLQRFLAAAVAEAKAPVEVCVTGHSKGGALSPTLALWLADTQGEAVPQEERWDPKRNATVYAYSFAGPTAGNGAFVQHFNAVLGDRSYRIANKLDVVPHAWATKGLQEIPTLYGLPPVEQQLLAGFVNELVNDVGRLDYQHVGQHVTELPGVSTAGPFLEQVVHQHLDGYFEQMGLSSEMNTATFFFAPGCEAPPI